MSEERRYYIENAITEDKWLIYDDAHRYGCTRSKPEILTFYTSNVNPVVVRRDVDTDTLFDTSIPLPHDWVNDLSDFESPLYKKIGDITLYMGENPSIYVGYATSKNSTVATLVENTSHDGYISIKDGSDSLYELYGITDHKCDNYYVQEGAVLVWYDSVEHLYWDNRPNKKIWVPEPPQIEVDTTSNSILPNPIPLDPIDCFSDIAEPIILGSLKSYRYYTAGKDWTSGKELEPIDFSPDFDIVDEVYSDLLSLNGFLYVIDENGADFQGVHYDYAEAIPADKFVAMVEPEGYDTFYKVQDLVIDLPYLVDSRSNEKYYWVESEGQYFTELGLESVGYYTSPIPPELFEFTNILLTCPLETYTLEEPNQSILPLGVQLLEYPPLIPDQPIQEYTYFCGDFSGNNIDIDSVDGGGSLIDRYSSSRNLIQLSGYESGSTIDRYNQSRSTFSLVGWNPGGMFELPEPVVLSYTLGGVLSSSNDDKIELLAPETMEIGTIELTRSLTIDTVSVVSLITNRLESDGIELTRALSSNVVPIESITGTQTIPPPMPTVTLNGFDSNGWFKFNTSGSNYTFNSGVITSIYKDGTTSYVQYDTSNTYSVIKYINSSSTIVGRTSISVRNSNNYIYANNISGQNLVVSRVKIAICNDNTATVVTVYNSNNDEYNSFKYTRDGVDYYWVLDDTQSDWEDDLSSIGYSLTPVIILPSVSVTDTFGSNNWLYTRLDGINENVRAGSIVDIKSNIGSTLNQVSYESTNSYAIITWSTYQAQAGSGRTEFTIVNHDGYLGAKNSTSNDLYLYALRCAVCSSQEAIVVVVHNTNNESFNAFKYTLNEVCYYYVLDGIQTDWTDDLSSIGYTEEQPFISDRFIDVTSETLALSPAPNYTPNGYFWIDNLARMPLSAYTTNTTQDYDYITWGYDDFKTSSINQSEIPTIIWLNAEWQYAPDAEVIESLGLTNEVNNAPEGSVILRVINEISGNNLEDLTFGNITRVEFIKIFYSDMVAYNYFGDGNQSISVWETSFDYDTMLHEGLPEIRFSSNGVTDTVTVPLSDCFLVKNNKVSYCAFKTLIPANTVHINGSLYNKPLIAEYGENTGLVIYEPTTYDL